jgi:hypothetical protein
MVDQFAPLSAENSIFTFAMLVDVQVIAAEVPTVSDSPPLGDTTVTAGGSEMLKTALLTSFVAVFDESLTRTRACVVTVFGTVHE